MKKQPKTLVVSATILFTAVALWAQDPPTEQPPAKKAADEWHTVAKGLIKVELDLDGVFASAAMTPIEVKTEAFASQGLKVVQPIEQGTVVKKGDLLVKFDTEDIDKAIRDATMAEAASKLSLESAEKELELTRRSAELDLAAAERSYARATADMERWVTVDRPMSEKQAREMLQRSKDQLEYAMEELKQLQKMYKEDDLTEETEEIILKRQQRSVDYTQSSLKQAERQHDVALNVTFPRRHEDMELSLEKERISLERARIQNASRLLQSEQGLEKARIAYKEAAKKLEELQADKLSLTVTAPADGVVYYGRNERGKWLDSAAVAGNMKEEGTIRPNTVFLTLVGVGPLFVNTEANETNIRKVQAGLNAWVTPTADPFNPLPAKVRSVAAYPVGNYEVVVDLPENADASDIKPGMTCKIKVTSYEQSDAVKVPLSAVKSDEPGVYHVFIKTGEDGAEKRIVKIGRRTATEAEVLEGLGEGDQIRKNG